MVIFRSLGHQVSPAGVSKEVRMLKLEYEPKVFLISEDHVVLRFCSVADYVKVKKGGPWFVGG